MSQIIDGKELAKQIEISARIKARVNAKQSLYDENEKLRLQYIKDQPKREAEQKAREVVAEVTPKQSGVDPRFIDWVSENSWYEKNQEMRDYADIIGQGYAAKHPGINPELVLKYVTKEVKSRFKDSFQNPNREKPTAVEGENNKSGGRGKSSF